MLKDEQDVEVGETDNRYINAEKSKWSKWENGLRYL